MEDDIILLLNSFYKEDPDRAQNAKDDQKYLFEDYSQTGCVYHVVSLTDLEKVLSEGIEFDDKKTYKSKYYDFHCFLDEYRPEHLPEWVERKKAIFGSINFPPYHAWHSHSAILSIKIDENKCWICNENLANFMFEPFFLQQLRSFEKVQGFMSEKAPQIAKQYWDTSLGFVENLKVQNDKKEGYDAEILIMHKIPPKDIKCLYVVSDHVTLPFDEWNEIEKINIEEICRHRVHNLLGTHPPHNNISSYLA